MCATSEADATVPLEETNHVGSVVGEELADEELALFVLEGAAREEGGDQQTQDGGTEGEVGVQSCGGFQVWEVIVSDEMW